MAYQLGMSVSTNQGVRHMMMIPLFSVSKTTLSRFCSILPFPPRKITMCSSLNNGEINRARTFKSSECTENELGALVDQIQYYANHLDIPSHEKQKMMSTVNVYKELLTYHSTRRWLNSYHSPYHETKLEAADISLFRYITHVLKLQMERDLQAIKSQFSLDHHDLATQIILRIKAENMIIEGCEVVPLHNFSEPYPSLKKYDIFISFRGDDIRSGFESHLYDALSKKKIQTYIDDRLDKGDELWPKLVQAIEDSVLYLVVFSENYASSSWCLRELTHILECTKDTRHHVLPVFYKVEPSHVRYQMAFAELERYYDEEEVTKWRESLNYAANISGWDSHDYGDEVELIQEIVTRVTKKLDTMFPSVYSIGHFGIDDQIAHVESLLYNESHHVQLIGLWGNTGIGKTTIANELFNKLFFDFDGSCFLDNIREESAENRTSFLKKKLLSTLLEDEKLHITNNTKRRLQRMKILVVLDDVNDPLQLTSLVGELCQFGKGSKIIITARDKQVFGKNVNISYEVKALDSHDALQLFKFHAFEDSNFSDKEFEKLSKKVVNYANGIPSVLITLGSFLYGKSIEEWRRQLEKITKIPYTKVQKTLRLSYNRIDEEGRNLLLDIASTYDDRRLEYICKLLDAFGYSEIDGLREILKGLNGGKQKNGQMMKPKRIIKNVLSDED